jgi:uncharacterized protein (TIGR03067 family)
MLLTLAASLLGQAGDPQAAQEQQRLEGTWKVYRVVESGVQPEGDKKKLLDTMEMVFKGTACTVHVGGQQVAVSSYAVRPAAAPAEMDLTVERDGQKVTMPAIYRVKDGFMQLCHPEMPGGTRPKEFASTAESKTVLMTLQLKPAQ